MSEREIGNKKFTKGGCCGETKMKIQRLVQRKGHHNQTCQSQQNKKVIEGVDWKEEEGGG